uniref:RNase_PH domain-containing protein n=1 Tax=Rhabditophanes sp. KR3021 TaxID=114890 RepID=A0AC35U0B6_9BILA
MSTSTEISAENALVLKAIYPRKYFEDFIKCGVFPDGRGIYEFEETEVDIGDQNQSPTISSTIFHSNCYVYTNRNIEIRRNVKYPFCLNVEIKKVGTKVNLESHFTQYVLNLLLSRGVLISPEALVTGEEALQFVINSELKLTGSTHGMLQPCLMGLISSLATIELPQLSLEESVTDDCLMKGSNIKVESEKPERLKLNDIPVATSFSLYQTNNPDEESKIIYDVPAKNKGYCVSTVQAITGRDQQIYYLSGGGSEALVLRRIKRFFEKSGEFRQKWEDQLNEKICK